MKNFSEVEVGDSVYMVKIMGSEIKDAIKEFKVKGFEEIPNAIHFRITLSDNTVITPSGIFPFHTANKGPDTGNALESIYEEIYSTDREECLRIASNAIKIKMQRIHRVIESCKNQLDKLGKCAIDIFDLSRHLPVEATAETVIV